MAEMDPQETVAGLRRMRAYLAMHHDEYGVTVIDSAIEHLEVAPPPKAIEEGEPDV